MPGKAEEAFNSHLALSESDRKLPLERIAGSADAAAALTSLSNVQTSPKIFF